MKAVYDEGSSQTIIYAASELCAYLKRMIPEAKQDAWEVRLAKKQGADGKRENDSFRVAVTQDGGSITGNNDRSVLIGVYDYLRYLGCRFLMPSAEGEYIPRIKKEKLAADYTKTASFYHRGICIEGADSFENIRDFIAWLPKAGYNSFFLQFKVPYAFLARWYHHEKNPIREAEEFTYEDAFRYMHLLEEELKKRDLMLHKAGHGWTGEVLGYEMSSWETANAPLDEQIKPCAAMLGGVRGLYHGAPTNTNLCYHSREASERFVEKVTSYAKENPDMDYLHIWLADEYNNVCECEACRKTTLSDQYVALLNEIDRRFQKENLNTRIVFLLYQELLWPPVKERLENPERFVLMFAPISRTFEKSYSLESIPDELPEYVRNNITLPANLGENLAFLRGWQAQFKGDSFVYDYPLGRAHYGDFGYVHIARTIGEDIKKLKEMGLDGYISCQELRAAFPNALPNYVMGYTLFTEDADTEKLIDEYFEAAYGEGRGTAEKYLKALSGKKCCDYLNGIGKRMDRRIAERMQQIQEICEEFRPKESGSIYWKLLGFHKHYVLMLTEAIRLLALGRKQEAVEKWERMREELCRHEEEFQPYLDVYRILEVTQKYTGFQ